MLHRHAVPERTTLLEMPPLTYAELRKPSLSDQPLRPVQHLTWSFWPDFRCQVHLRRVHRDLQSLYSLNAVENQ